MLNLDTHVLLHAVGGELSAAETRLLSGDSWSVCPIVFWEIGKLGELGRIHVTLDDSTLQRVLARVHVWPITLDVCRAIHQLDFRGDPADELIAATSLTYGVPLVTRDSRIRRSRRVPLARQRGRERLARG
jgi:PIN domain nuclease of toxin-antitoxin system